MLDKLTSDFQGSFRSTKRTDDLYQSARKAGIVLGFEEEERGRNSFCPLLNFFWFFLCHIYVWYLEGPVITFSGIMRGIICLHWWYWKPKWEKSNYYSSPTRQALSCWIQDQDDTIRSFPRKVGLRLYPPCYCGYFSPQREVGAWSSWHA